MKEKMCPLTQKYCVAQCGWLLKGDEPNEPVCAMAYIGNDLHSLVKSLTWSLPDEPMTELVENVDNIGTVLRDLTDAVNSIASGM